MFLPSIVVLSLLACLSSSVREVRRAATATLQTLAQVDSSPFHPIIDRLLKTTEELTTGPTHLSQVRGAHTYIICILNETLCIK